MSSRPACTSRGTIPVTPREWELIGFLCAGLSTARIAAELTIAVAAASTRVGRVMAKLGAASRAELVVATAGRRRGRPTPSGLGYGRRMQLAEPSLTVWQLTAAATLVSVSTGR